MKKRKKKIRLKENRKRENRDEDNIDIGWFFKIATTDNTRSATILKVHENRKEILGVYTGDIQNIGDVVSDEHKGTKAMRLMKIEAYESYINSNAMDFDADDSLLTGYIYYLYTQLHLN